MCSAVMRYAHAFWRCHLFIRIGCERTTPGRLSAFLVPASCDAYSIWGVAREIMRGSRDMSAMVTAAERLGALREALADASVDGMIVPRADAHQSEYLPASAERVAWLTGFSGSAGTAVVLRDKAAVFTDGRYSLQIESQVDARPYQRFNIA